MENESKMLAEEKKANEIRLKKQKLMSKKQDLIIKLTSTLNKTELALLSRLMQTTEKLNKLESLELISTILKYKK